MGLSGVYFGLDIDKATPRTSRNLDCVALLFDQLRSHRQRDLMDSSL